MKLNSVGVLNKPVYDEYEEVTEGGGDSKRRRTKKDPSKPQY